MTTQNQQIIGEPPLEQEDVRAFLSLRQNAIDYVSNRFYAEYPLIYEKFGERGREACREDIAFNLDFLRPALEFGFIQPFIEYLCWLSEVLTNREIPSDHIFTSLDWMAEFFLSKMPACTQGGRIIADTLFAAKNGVLAGNFAPSMIDQNTPEQWPEFKTIKSALLCGDRRRAEQVFNERIQQGYNILDIELNLIQPALYQVGIDWAQNKVSVAQEHLATATAMTLMAQFSGRTKVTLNGKKAVFACVEGNHHDVGLRIVADAFELKGWDVIFLGANNPTESLVQMVKSIHPDLVGLSVSFPHQLQTVRVVIAEIRHVFGDDCPAVMVGGLAINAFSKLMQFADADATANNAAKSVSAFDAIAKRDLFD